MGVVQIESSPWLQFSCTGIKESSSMVPVESHSGVLKTVCCVGYNAEVMGCRDSGFVSGCSKCFQLEPWSRIFVLINFLAEEEMSAVNQQ